MNIKTIYDEYQHIVYNLCLQYVQNQEDAQDISQEVFLTIFQKKDTFKNECKLSTWIYRIAINKCIDFNKAQKTKKRFAFITSLFTENNDLKHEVSHFDHPGIALENKETFNKIFERINKLPPQQKTAIILHKIEQKTQIETAEIMNISAKAVESLVQRAKKYLWQYLETNKGK